MSWGTPIAQANAVPQPIVRADNSVDWSPVTSLPTYDPANYNASNNPLSAAWLAERDRLLAEWENAKGVLERAKESEINARKAAQSFAFPPNAKEGMNNQPLANGFVLKFGKKLNYGLKATVDQIDKAEEEAAKVGNRGTFLFERIITWTPEFSKSEYNKLATDDPTDVAVKKLIDSLIEIKEGTGSLEIKAPKATLNG